MKCKINGLLCSSCFSWFALKFVYMQKEEKVRSMARHATKSDGIKRLFRFIFFRLKYRLRTEEKESCMWFLRKVGKSRTKRSLLDSACSRLKDAELYYTSWCNQFLRLLWDLPFPACSKREMHTEIGKSGNLLNKSRFCGLQ